MSSEKTGASVIPLTDFEACDLGSPIASLNRVDMTSVSQAFLRASSATPSPCKEVFGLLSAIAGIHLNPTRGSIRQRWIGRRPKSRKTKLD
jgi:hypothetical protein